LTEIPLDRAQEIDGFGFEGEGDGLQGQSTAGDDNDGDREENARKNLSGAQHAPSAAWFPKQ
jgi:hypothetical protein